MVELRCQWEIEKQLSLAPFILADMVEMISRAILF